VAVVVEQEQIQHHQELAVLVDQVL